VGGGWGREGERETEKVKERGGIQNYRMKGGVGCRMNVRREKEREKERNNE
jgi:hypothetical protein